MTTPDIATSVPDLTGVHDALLTDSVAISCEDARTTSRNARPKNSYDHTSGAQ
jgi:hypothetical protein